MYTKGAEGIKRYSWMVALLGWPASVCVSARRGECHLLCLPGGDVLAHRRLHAGGISLASELDTFVELGSVPWHG
ncbi:MAG TPA: hypothetical protein VGC99_21100, partial [Candidatus Tectomicrobia bacterium]